MTRVAVTGGSGNVGRYVVKALVDRGYDVINLDHKQSREPAAKFSYVDLTKRDQVHRALEGVDAVCHLGELAGPRHGAPDHVYVHNAAAGSAVLQSAAELGVKRVVYASSAHVYGCFGGPIIAPVRLPFDETHPLLPQNAYGVSKLANEAYTRFISEQYGVSAAILRLPLTLPWSMDMLTDMHWGWLKASTGPAEGFGSVLHSEDAARAFVLALENPRDGCEAYHLAAREVISAAPLAERMKVHNPDYPALPEDWPAFKCPLITDKIEEHLGWNPEHNLLDLYREKFGADPNEPVAPRGAQRARHPRFH